MYNARLMGAATTPRRGAGDLLAIGFGTTVAMWSLGYLARLPVVLAPAPFVLVLLLAALALGGVVAGRFGPRGIVGGLYAGAITGLLNLLVLGSFLSHAERPNALVTDAALWVPGAIAASALVCALGAFAGSRRRRPVDDPADWTGAFAWVAVGATFLLLVAGGLVTSNQAGLAVVDWPNSFGYNMFLYPISRMTGGIYYEHAHRLLGSLVGLTTVALAVHLALAEPRAWVRRMAYAAVPLVIVQGILGGLRVTGKPTLSTDPAVTEPNIYLAVVHGVSAQIFFALQVAIAVACSRTWRAGGAKVASARAPGDRALGTLAIAALVVQITLGAVQRHLGLGLMIHITLAMFVAGLTIAAGARAWGLYPDQPPLKRAGLAVIHATLAQFLLGFAAWLVRGAWERGAIGPEWKVAVTTLHQGTGAILLASAVALRLWLSRVLR